VLSQGVGYAITALSYIAAAGGRSVLVKDIAQATDIPPAYLAKLVHALGKRGVVTTQRGVGGGVVLSRPATEISLFELAAALEDPLVEPRCLLGNAICSNERNCPAHAYWAEQREKIHEYLKTTRVADIAAFEAKRRWNQVTPRGSTRVQLGRSQPTTPT